MTESDRKDIEAARAIGDLTWLLNRIASWTNARFDQHARSEFGDERTDALLSWLEANGIRPFAGYASHSAYAVHKRSDDTFWVPFIGWLPRDGVVPPQRCGMSREDADEVLKTVGHYDAEVVALW